MHRRLALVVLILSVFVSGCASRRSALLRSPESREEHAFQYLTAFYCKEKRWPASWDEFVTFALPHEAGDALVRYFGSPRISSQRAILLTVDYQDETAGPRRVSFIAPPQCVTNTDPMVVSMAAGRVLFNVPHGFSVLGGKAIEERWKRPPFPDAAWDDPVSEVVIALRFGEAELPAKGVSAIKSDLEKAYESSVTNLSWLVRKVKKQGSSEFILHEYESDSVKGRLLTASLTYAFDGKPLTVNVVGPVGQRDAIEAVAEKLYASFRLE